MPSSDESLHRDDVELPPDRIRELFHAVADLIAGRIACPSPSTISGASRREIESLLPDTAPREGLGPDELLRVIRDEYLVHVRDYRHPLHYGHQRPAPLAATAIADFAAQALNPTVTMYEGSPYSVSLEKCVLRWMTELIGFPEGAGGTLVAGGAEATLTALLCARERASLAGQRERPVIFASDQVHYSVERAAHILGLGASALLQVPSDARLSLDIGRLEAMMATSARAGETPLAVVATAGTTGTGSFDDLRAAARIAARYGAWFHVDAAHGGSALIAPELRGLLDGIEHADSVVWNPHKLLWVASPCSAIMVRRRRDLAIALAPGVRTASYVVPRATDILDDPDEDPDEPLRWTIACTRYFSAMRVYAAFLVYGTSGLARRLTRMCELAKDLHAAASAHGAFELLVNPAFNVTCFRFVPPGTNLSPEAVDTVNQSLRDRLARGTEAYLTGVKIHGRYWLRAQFMSENITPASNRKLLALVEREGRLCAAHLD
jgi:glutamate/tyrosine decarboxylase-like PLP-dependent enzyme